MRGVGAGHAERYTFGKKEGARRRVVKLTAIVTLHRFDGASELGEHVGEKIGKSSESIRLEATRAEGGADGGVMFSWARRRSARTSVNDGNGFWRVTS